MNYILHYERLITRARTRTRPECYTEKHHIIPRCMGGGDEIENIAILTAEEHYVAHQLLVKIYPNNRKLLYAIQAMSMPGSSDRGSNKMYAWLRSRFNESRRTGVYKQCKNCNREFYARAHRFSKPYCSKECYHNYSSSIVTCIHCAVEFVRPKSLNTSKDKYCSIKCKTNFKSYIFNCSSCNLEVRVPTCRLKQGIPKYCSRKCKGNCR